MNSISSQTLLIAFFIIAASNLACRNDESATDQAQQISLSGPTVFVPVGTLKAPQGIAVDDAGNVWIADSRNNRLRKFSAAGNETDSISFVFPPTKVAIRKPSGDLLVVEDEKIVHHIIAETKSTLATYPLNPFTGDASVVFNVNTQTTRSLTPTVLKLGDIDSSPGGDIFVSAYGSPENMVIKIQNGNISAIASSAVTPTNTFHAGARFLALDRFGTLFTSFTFPGTSGLNVVRAYSLNPSNIVQSKVLNEPDVSGARGATVDGLGFLYIADPATQELVIVSTALEKTILRYRIPDTGGFSMVPQDVAVASDGSVYVVINDRIGTDAGAVLKYAPHDKPHQRIPP